MVGAKEYPKNSNLNSMEGVAPMCLDGAMAAVKSTTETVPAAEYGLITSTAHTC